MKSKIKTGDLTRSFNFNRSAIDEEARTVELAFSSEAPVERWFGMEVLDHSIEAVDLERLNNGGAPLLLNHNSNDQIGVVENARVESGKGRALVRFSKSEKAQEIFQDVVDGIRTCISVGYRILEMKLEESTDEVDTYRATKWQPYEISSVPIPADAFGAGVGRSEIKGDNETTILNFKTKEKERKMTEKTKEITPTIDVKDVQNKAMEAERSRVTGINAIVEAHPQLQDVARQFIDSGKSLDEFRKVALDKVTIKDVKTPNERMSADLDMSNKDKNEYSLFRAINAAVTGDWRNAGFELEASLAIADKLGRNARGFFVPTDIFANKRAMSTGGAGTGAEFVGTDHMGNAFIDALTNKSVVAGLGAQVLSGLEGNVDIPKLISGATWGWIDEDADAGENDAVTGSLDLSPKTVAGGIPMSRRLLKQSSPSIEQMVRNDLVRGAALAIDLAALSGAGGSAPTGILNTTGVGSVAGIDSYGKMIDLWSKVAADNADVANMAYVLNATNAGTLMQAPKDTGSGIMTMTDGKINGYQAMVSNQLPGNKVVFGDFSQLVIGMWGVLDIVADTSTKAKSGGLVLRAFQDADIGIKHAESFAVGTSA